jgi:hypothetical protein
MDTVLVSPHSRMRWHWCPACCWGFFLVGVSAIRSASEMRRARQDRRVYRYAWTTAWREQQHNVETTDTIPRKNCIAPVAVSTRRLFRITTSVRNRTRVLDLRIHANTKKTLRTGTTRLCLQQILGKPSTRRKQTNAKPTATWSCYRPTECLHWLCGYEGTKSMTEAWHGAVLFPFNVMAILTILLCNPGYSTVAFSILTTIPSPSGGFTHACKNKVSATSIGWSTH